ncbi:hypothetical protein JCM4814A_20750 [Streptomyces phaeofaciens JCM 4814]|uniref:DUF3592 domain-containing protein n=1 Tax=Streptomyces phaeofaciens TaxID=68254 RepID=A0A918HG97_9ACTN|nr:DUF3592 domain-containing protein [Streptomyces phaeofaciens]GGT56147.1 hypothetical protein GCM10010226_36620 [Streptomyces phaeofaciens]
MAVYYLLGYLVPAAVFTMGVLGYSTRFTLNRRGVRVTGVRAGESWNAGIYSLIVHYTDQDGKKHRLSVAPEDVPKGGSNKIPVVYDPRKPGSALSEFELRKPGWKTMDMGFCYIGAGIAVGYTVLVLFMG